MKSKFIPLILILIFIITFVIFYKGLKNPNIYTPNTNLEKEVPPFELKSFENDSIIISEKIFKNNDYYFMNVWASWCIPCKVEHEFLMKLKNNEKIKLIGLNYKDNEINAQKFLDELGNPFETILVDIEGVQAIEWGAFGVPESFLILNNKVVKKYIGPLNENLIKEIKLIIK